VFCISDIPENVFVCACHVRKCIVLSGSGSGFSCGSHSRSITSLPGSAKSNGFSRIPSTTLKIDVTAPMPSASVRIAVTANPGCLRRVRALKRKS